MSAQLLLCAFLLTCFDKPIDDKLCTKGCACFEEPNGEISAICETKVNEINTEFVTKTISSLAFKDNGYPINFDILFPVKRTVKNLIIHDSKFNYWAGDQYDLFSHIEKTQYLTFTNVYFAGWKWEKLVQNLLEVKGIHCESCYFDDFIPVLVGHISTDNVVMLSIINSQFKQIEPQALKWPNLRQIVITGNNIPKLNREWFANNLNDLWSLDLRFNGINEIPEEFFNNMPKLKQLKLSGNFLKTLTWKTYGPVWDNLNEFWISGNLIDCSGDLRWITEKKKYPLFFGDGQCRHSGYLSHDFMIFYRANNYIDVDRLAAS